MVRVERRSGIDVSGWIRLELVGESEDGGGDDEVVGEGIGGEGGIGGEEIEGGGWMFE